MRTTVPHRSGFMESVGQWRLPYIFERTSAVPSVLAISLAFSGRALAELPASLAPRALAPSPMRVAANETIELRIVAPGAPADRAQRWPEDEIAWFFHRADGKQANRDTLAPTTPGGDRAALTPADAGVSMIGLQFKPQAVTLNEKQLDELRQRLEHKSDDKNAAPPAAAKGVRVRHQSCAAALIHVSSANASADEPSAIATSKSGLKAEIRPMLDPTRCKVGDELPVRVYADGDRAAGARVRAISPDGKEASSVTNPAGFATIAIAAAGTWRIEIQQLVPARDDPDAEWVLYSGSLTFEAADAVAPKQGGTR